MNYVNSIGQTLSPGDKVIGVSDNRSIRIREGTYVGLSPSGSPQFRAMVEVFGYWSTEGKNVGWRARGMPGVKFGTRNVERITTLHSGRVFKIA